MGRIRIRLRTMMIIVAFLALIFLVVIQRIELNRAAALLQMQQSRMDYARAMAEQQRALAEVEAARKQKMIEERALKRQKMIEELE
jgi:hypothetical protein